MDHDRVYGPDETFAPAELLRRCAEEYGTPVLVYSGRVLAERQALIRRAFSWNPGYRQYFPVPVADELGLLRLFCRVVGVFY